MKLNTRFSVRGPDRVEEELATVLSKKGAFEFRALFDIVHANLRSRDLARGGEEMLRLRAHEKLQNFLRAGIVTKTGKEYTGVPKALEAFFKTAAELRARLATGRYVRPDPAVGNPVSPEKASEPLAAPSTTATKRPKNAKTKLPVRKAKKGHGKESQKGRKAAAKA